ncbi:hypothetical protein J1N35_023013 [Gossypium stocksii]|uniref:Uncharacterized protein n=1 Tax=Gossypium stocksii TaxID=47602 RepID=A0A9D3VIY2_9ROSI|nr:hypothetical protein J1N35_023013 [Gossypium stocksii]
MFRNWASNLHLNRNKYIQLSNKLRNGFEFPIQWSIPLEFVCTHRQPLDNEPAEKQFNSLKLDFSLVLKNLIIVRKVFHFCLENHNSNGYRPTDIAIGVDSQVVHPSDTM